MFHDVTDKNTVQHKILTGGNFDILQLAIDCQNLTCQFFLKALQRLQVHGERQ